MTAITKQDIEYDRQKTKKKQRLAGSAKAHKISYE
jgi:hypothetical protein